MKMDVLLINANCQGAPIADAISKIPAIANNFEIVRLRYEELEETLSDIEMLKTITSRTTVFWEQVTDNLLEQRQYLAGLVPRTAKRLRFPALTCASMWPFSAEDRRRPLVSTLGYDYSDFVAAKVARDITAAGRDVTDIVAVSDTELYDLYSIASQKFMPTSDQVLNRDIKQWQHRDKESDISLTDFLISRLREERLFWTSGRCTWTSLRQNLIGLLTETFGTLEEYADIDSKLKQIENTYKANYLLSVPINPAVAKSLDLQWFDPEEKTYWYRHLYTFEEWINRCIRFYPYMT